MKSRFPGGVAGLLEALAWIQREAATGALGPAGGSQGKLVFHDGILMRVHLRTRRLHVELLHAAAPPHIDVVAGIGHRQGQARQVVQHIHRRVIERLDDVARSHPRARARQIQDHLGHHEAGLGSEVLAVAIVDRTKPAEAA